MGEGGITLAEPNLVVQKHSEHIAKQCPECRFGVEEGQIIVLCPVCKSPHHEHCWYDAGGCGKVGCRGVATARPSDVQSSLAMAQRQRGAQGDAQSADNAQKKSPVGTVITVVAVLAIAWLLYYAVFR